MELVCCKRISESRSMTSRPRTRWLDSLLCRWRQYRRVELPRRQTWLSHHQTQQRLAKHQRSPCPLNRDNRFKQPNQIQIPHNGREIFPSSHTYRRFLGVQHVCLERPLMTLIGDDKIHEILDWTLLHLITLIFQLEVGMFNKKLEFNVLVSHRSGSVAALEGPKDVTEYMVRFVMCWGRGVLVCVSSCVKTSQQRWLCRTLLSGHGQFETIPRNTPRYSHGCLGHWRNRYVQRYFKYMLITTATVTSFLCSCRIFPGW